MRAFPTNPLQYLTILCLSTLATAGCHKNKGEESGKSNESATVLSDTTRHASHAIILHDRNGEDYEPTIDPENFARTIDNPYMTLTPGRVWIYEGKNEDGETERVEIKVTPDSKNILGVVTTVVREREWVENELVEDTFDWFAQDKEGNVWYFGEESKEIEAGQVVSTAGSWEAGMNGAKAGIIMKANPQIGDAYRQEYLKDEAEDLGKVLGIHETVTIGLGNFENCVKIQDWNPLEPEVSEHKYYSKEAGNLILEKKVAGESGQMELIEMKTE